MPLHIIVKGKSRRLYLQTPDGRQGPYVRELDLLSFIARNEPLQVLAHDLVTDITRPVFLALFARCERLAKTPQLSRGRLYDLIQAAIPFLPALRTPLPAHEPGGPRGRR